MDFLKAALAPPDFPVGTFQGIPDSYDGRVVTKSWNYVGSQPAFNAGYDLFIVQMPVPGVAYFWGNIASGGTTLTLTPVYYADYLSLFPANNEAANVTAFRYGGQAMEIIPTVNAMTWTGSVHMYRGAIKLGTYGVTSSSIGYVLEGLEPMCNSAKPETVHPFNLGCYCASRQNEPDFPFHDITPATITSEIGVAHGTSGFAVAFAAGTNAFMGMGSMDAIVYKIPAASALGNLFTIRTWAHTEMQVTSASSLYEYAHISPPLDPVALALAKRAFEEMQLCVPFYENDGLWGKILSFIKEASATLSFLPGPYGEVATGVGLIASAVSNMVI